MPFVPSSFLLLVAMPGAPSSVLAPFVAMPGSTCAYLTTCVAYATYFAYASDSSFGALGTFGTLKLDGKRVKRCSAKPLGVRRDMLNLHPTHVQVGCQLSAMLALRQPYCARE